MADAGDILIDGVPATREDLTHVALVNYGAYTSFRVESGGVRGLDLHLARLEAEALELFGAAVGEARLRDLMRRAVADRGDCWLRVSLFSPEVSPRTPGRPAVVSPRCSSACATPASIGACGQVTLSPRTKPIFHRLPSDTRPSPSTNRASSNPAARAVRRARIRPKVATCFRCAASRW